MPAGHIRDKELTMTKNARRKIHKWLQTGEDIFHIAGKLGCGKSTLMQLLRQHQFVQKELERWTGKHVDSFISVYSQYS